MLSVFLILLLDRAFPTIVRMFGPAFAISLLPWGDREAVKSFYEKYGWVSLPRSVFLLVFCVSAYLWAYYPNFKEIIVAICVVSFVLWGVFAMRDTQKAAGF